MKILKSLLFLLFIISPYDIFSQENFNSLITERIQKDALFREKVFIHLNKTTYFTDENIWFTSFIAGDDDNIPSYYTNTLYVNLLNHNGDIIEHKNIFITKGVGIGDFLIDNKYPPGKYYIQGFTNYMQNFGPENVFIQEIEIINPTIPKEIKEKINTNKYDIQVFPESGYLLEGTENIIGIKALINGKGYPFSGKIINSESTEIATFKGNPFGMSKCNFNYVKNETYSAIIEINETIQKVNLPKAISTGIIFSIDNSNQENVKLTLKTNKETLPSLIDQTLNLLFYRNNYICESATLSFINSENTELELVFNKSEMLNGVNIVTLFKNNQPIAERKFFIDKPTEQTAVLVEELQTKNDSLNFKIQTINSDHKPIPSQLSISMLPKDSKAYHETQNIKTAFLLSPYIKGQIENPSYYFKNSNSKENEFLDLLLLNQGWIAYSLEEKIKELNPNEKFHFESGFTINGKIKYVPKGYDIGIISKKNNLVATSAFNENKEFSFENIFAYKHDSIKLALYKIGKPLVKPSQIILKNYIEKEQNYSALTNKFNPYPIIEKKFAPIKENMSLSNSPRYPNIVQFDEIILKNVKSKRKETIYDLELNMASEHHILDPDFYKSKKVTQQMENRNVNLFDYFERLGYITNKNSWLTNASDFYITLGRGPVTVHNKTSNPDGTMPPTIFIDDTPISNYNVLALFKDMNMSFVDEILINKSGAGGGSSGGGGIIKIYTKKGTHKYFGEEENINLYENLILLTGFDRANEYYRPFYNVYTKNTYNWTEINWENSVKSNEKGEIFIKIPTNEFSNELQFIINGFSEGGLLFYNNYKTGEASF